MAEILLQTPDNPLPEGITAAYLSARDGVHLRYAILKAPGSRGTAVLLTGRNESIEKYFETMRDLAARGFTTAIFDWRGQGGSDRLLRDPRRGHVERFDAYVQDLDQFFEEVVLPDCRPPYNVLAHSMGALIALSAADKLVNRVRRMVLLAPPLTFSAPMSMKWLKRLAGFYFALGLGSRYLPGTKRRGVLPPFKGNRLTTDVERFTRNQNIVRAHPQLGLGGPTAAWIYAACLATEQVREPDFMASVRIPTLFIAAGADQVVSTPAIERYARHLRSGSSITVDGARHEMLQETDLYREQVIAAFAAFAKTGEIA
jgi:lysophospholipase